MEKIKNKDYKIVFLYFIGIIIVVLGHTGSSISLVFEFFKPYSFHLGLFIFCSGYLFKKENTENISKFIWKKFKKFIIPMYIWHLFYGIIINLLHLKGFTMGGKLTLKNIFIMPLTTGHEFVFSLSLWFVVPLFIIEVVSIIILKVLKNREYIFFIIYFLLGILGLTLASKGYNHDWYLLLTKTLYFFPFFGLGYLYKNKLYKYDKINNILYFAICFAIQLIMITLLDNKLSFTAAWMINFPKNPLFAYIVGFNGIFFWFRISRIIENYVKNSKTINYIAERTYPIMVHNVFGMFLVKTIYAVLTKLNIADHPINWIKYKSDIWYSYLPFGLSQYYITYFVGSILFCLGFDYLFTKLQMKLFKKKIL